MNKIIEQAICKVTGVTDAEKWAQYNQTAFQIAEDIVKQMMKGAIEGNIVGYPQDCKGAFVRFPVIGKFTEVAHFPIQGKIGDIVKIIILPSDNK